MATAVVNGEPGESQDDGDGGAVAAVVELRRAAEMVRLANRLHGLPHDPAARKRELLEGMVRLVEAGAGTCVVGVAAAGGPVVLSAAHAGRAGARRRRPSSRGVTHAGATGGGGDEADRHDAAVHDVLGRLFPRAARGGAARAHVSDGGGSLFSSVRLDGRGTAAAGIVLVRDGAGDRRPFDRVDRAVVEMVHFEMRWVYALDVPLGSPDVLPLSRRMKETLQLLLAGNAEKQIARQMGLSLNTVHHYVKQLYRHFGVSTRSELLARWLRAKRPTRGGGRKASAD